MAAPEDLEKLSLLERAVESAPDGIAILDGAGQFIYANDRYRELFGIEDKRILGDDWWIAFPPRERGFLTSEVFKDVEISGEWRGEVIAEDSTGTARIVELSVSDVGNATAWFARVTRRNRNRLPSHRYD